MPELPEVETVRAGLASKIIGARVVDVSISDARSLKRHVLGPKHFVDELLGQCLLAVVRRGKFLWLPLSDSRALVGHLGMSGQMLLRDKGHDSDPQTRVVLSVESQSGQPLEIRFVDQRIFGSLAIEDLVPTSDGAPGGFSPESPVGSSIPAVVAHIARDLLDQHFNSDSVVDKMQARSSGIKRVLLDQNLLSGIGNIYADESLWLARSLTNDQPTNSIAPEKLTKLISIATGVLERAVIQGGTSFDEQYKNVNGDSGYFAQSPKCLRAGWKAMSKMRGRN